MSTKEKEAAAKQTFTFLVPLTNEQSCEAGRESAIARVREYRVDIITLKKKTKGSGCKIFLTITMSAL